MGKRNEEARLETIKKLENLNDRRSQTIRELKKTIHFLKKTGLHYVAIETLENDIEEIRKRIPKTEHRIRRIKEDIDNPPTESLQLKNSPI